MLGLISLEEVRACRYAFEKFGCADRIVMKNTFMISNNNCFISGKLKGKDKSCLYPTLINYFIMDTFPDAKVVFPCFKA